MEIISAIDLVEELAQGQRIGFLQRTYNKAIHKQFAELTKTLKQREQIYSESMEHGFEAQNDALLEIYQATESVANAHELLAQVNSMERRATSARLNLTSTIEEIATMAQTEIDPGLIPEDLGAALNKIKNAAGQPKRSAKNILSLGISPMKKSALTALRWCSKSRLWALHSLLLLKIAHQSPDNALANEDELDALNKQCAKQLFELRDSAHRVAGELRDYRLTPTIIMQMWSMLNTFETWLMDEGIDALTKCMAVATAQVQAQSDEALRWARGTGKAYDAIRTSVALDAGLREVLFAYAANDVDTLQEFASSFALKLGAATLDLPRSSLAEAARAEEGTIVEIDGIITDAQYVAGGPAPYSVLMLGSEQGTCISVLVPYASVDSFGVVPGIWLHVRGKMYPNGKKDLEGPVLEVRRIRREAASESSFLDWLLWSGRKFFQVRPNGLDIMAGRLTGDMVTLNEIGLHQ